MKIRSDKRELDKIFKRRDRYEIPDWQRDEVWDESRKQLLVDSILRGWRLPKFYFVQTSSNPLTYEVVDGQQRLATIFEFLSGELELSDETASEFGGKNYKSLPLDISDRVDDFEIDFDEIEEASDSDLMEFFQRLQSGLQLNSSEKLNAIQSKLRNFCKKQAKHKFFQNCVAFNDKRYAHFDVMAKVATLEVDGIEASLRYADVRSVFESQASFSDKSQVAKRITAALDFLAASIPSGSKLFRNRSFTQSFINMICRLQQAGALSGKEKAISGFAESFVKGLAAEIEKGQDATDADYILFQRSVNANVRSGPAVRQGVLFRKLLQFEPDFVDQGGDTLIGLTNFSDHISLIAKDIRQYIEKINDGYSSITGKDLFKSTNKTVAAQNMLGTPISSFDTYRDLIEKLYFLFWEGPGSKISQKPTSFVDINLLRTELEHDVDHGKAKDVSKKKVKQGAVFKKYSGSTAPSVASPSRFPLLQLRLLEAVKTDLQTLANAYA